MNITRETAYTTTRPDIMALVPPSAGSVLDVGCSNGALGASLRQVSPGRRVVGIEYDPAFVAEAGLQLDRVYQADLNKTALSSITEGETFDCIIFADVLEHLYDPRKVLSGVKECLNTGGCVIVSVPNVRHLSSFLSIFVKGSFPARDRGLFDRTHLRWFTVGDAKAMLQETGLAIREASFSLRWGDQGGGFANKALNRALRPVKGFWFVREFLAYQICLRGGF